MKIAIVGTIASSMISFRGRLLQALADAGHRVYAFAIDYDEGTESRIRALGAEPIRYNMSRTGVNPFRDLASLKQLARLLRRCEIDVIVSYFIKPVVYGSLAASIAGVPRRFALLPGLGYAFVNINSKQSLRRRALAILLVHLLRLALKGNERLFLYNPDDIAEVVRLCIAAPEKITRLNGTGVDLIEYPEKPAFTDPVTFLLAARLLREKGVSEYAAAARDVRRDYPEVRFILLGGLDTNPGALSKAEVCGWVEDGILEWMGHVCDVRPWLERSSVYVLPSYREGVPRSTQEAMATGRPVITTDAPGCRETVVDEKSGYLVPPQNEKVLAERMRRFVEQPSLIASMGRASRQLAEERFNVHNINRQIMDALGLG